MVCIGMCLGVLVGLFVRSVDVGGVRRAGSGRVPGRYRVGDWGVEWLFVLDGAGGFGVVAGFLLGLGGSGVVVVGSGGVPGVVAPCYGVPGGAGLGGWPSCFAGLGGVVSYRVVAEWLSSGVVFQGVGDVFVVDVGLGLPVSSWLYRGGVGLVFTGVDGGVYVFVARRLYLSDLRRIGRVSGGGDGWFVRGEECGALCSGLNVPGALTGDEGLFGGYGLAGWVSNVLLEGIVTVLRRTSDRAVMYRLDTGSGGVERRVWR